MSSWTPRDWTDEELKKVRAELGVRRAVDIAREIGISVHCLYTKGREMGFRRVAKKSREFYWVDPDGEDSGLDLSPYSAGEFAWMNAPRYKRQRRGKQLRRSDTPQPCGG